MLVDSGQEWTFDALEEMFVEVERIAKDKFKLNTYPNQIDVINSEQMLDAYSAVGLPIYYNHWSFGQQFVQEQEAYRRGHMGLAYEIVINSSPCISYLMEENTMMMQTLVTAHAAFGHNHFFKNNYLFRQWTDAEAIIDYLKFAKKYIRDCEERYGIDEVERVLDACHALQQYGVDKYRRPSSLSAAQEEAQRKEREDYLQSQLNDIWRTIPVTKDKVKEEEPNFPPTPEENILYFIEKNAPHMETWKREIIRIVRKIAQYFYPQGQTKVMNEGCATFFHYEIMHELHKEGLLTDGAMLEFYSSHTNVVFQPDFDDRRYGGINPYALGFGMMQDIKRIATEPTDEDREWFRGQEWVGRGDWIDTIHWAIENFKDESFIQQFLSPKMMRDMRLFAYCDDDRDPQYEITGIHNKVGYKKVRETLSKQYNIGYRVPDIQVNHVDRWGDRSLELKHFMVDRRPLDSKSAVEVLNYIAYLWDYDVRLISVDSDGEVRAQYEMTEGETTIDLFMDEDD